MIKTRWRLFGNLRKGMEKMDKKDEIMLVNQESLAEKIYIIRGQKVMLDFELAEIYGYETKISTGKSRTISRSLKAKILCLG